MSELTVAMLLGFFVGAAGALVIGFLGGRIYERRANARSKFAKMEAEFEETSAGVKQRIKEARDRHA